MSRHQKLLRRFLAKPRDFTYDELDVLLRGFGYRQVKSGKTAGSRVAFFNEAIKHIVRFHKPHPSNALRRYQLDDLERELKRKGFIS
ncbi:MAG: type II toxin-antitoxin system HicA family toxin [Candidatus Aminicenantes bacterium]|nr:type II toxin-antitoxin system HicA family toxin [Candidatus Aminicenantes bacterium]